MATRLTWAACAWPRWTSPGWATAISVPRSGSSPPGGGRAASRTSCVPRSIATRGPIMYAGGASAKASERSRSPCSSQRETLCCCGRSCAPSTRWHGPPGTSPTLTSPRSEEHTSELQSQSNVVCRLLLEKKNRTAAGEPLPFGQEDVSLHGHAMECRINAEDPRANFAPAPGRILGYREPKGSGIRVDSVVAAGAIVSEYYDPLIAKVVVHAKDRAATIAIFF